MSFDSEDPDLIIQIMGWVKSEENLEYLVKDQTDRFASVGQTKISSRVKTQVLR